MKNTKFDLETIVAMDNLMEHIIDDGIIDNELPNYDLMTDRLMYDCKTEGFNYDEFINICINTIVKDIADMFSVDNRVALKSWVSDSLDAFMEVISEDDYEEYNPYED